MFRPQSRFVLGLLLLLLATPLLAGTVYQWTDARGITHYSDSPPPKGASKVREIGGRPPAQTATKVKASATPAADNAQCAQARLNLVRLQGNTEVGLDADRDGKPDAPFSAAERAAQVTLAQAAIKGHCPGST